MSEPATGLPPDSGQVDAPEATGAVRRGRTLARPVAAALLGLGVIGGAQLLWVRHQVESDLTQASRQALDAAGLRAARVAFDGRDGTLSGITYGTRTWARACLVVAGVDGVRAVGRCEGAAAALTTTTPTPTPTSRPTSSPRPSSPTPTRSPSVPEQSTPARSPKPTSPGPTVTPTGPDAPGAAPGGRGLTGAARTVQEQLDRLRPLTYATGSATPTRADRTTIRRIARILAAHPELRIRIDGHTDDTGSRRVNRELSAGRARVVLLDLLYDGVDRKQLSTRAFGSSRPKVPNTSEANRAQNRRVEITVLAPGA